LVYHISLWTVPIRFNRYETTRLSEVIQMPVVEIHMLEGRTLEQKRQLVKLVTEALVKSLGVKAEDVTILIDDVLRHNASVGGKLTSDEK